MQTYHVGEFADMAGVTVRTLRYYDQSGLLRPARRGSTRQYRHTDLLRLQQILTLKAMGFSLNEIRDLLEDPHYDLRRSFTIQREAIRQEIERLQKALTGLDLTIAHLEATKQIDWGEIAVIIAALNADYKQEWARRYYSNDQWARFAQSTPEEVEAGTRAWMRLTEDFQAARHLPPDHPTVQALAARQVELVRGFTKGDPEIERSLRAMYADFERIPQEFRLFDRDLLDFINAAVTLYKERHP
jgi:DNA-binding transcriptional MerR regulator